MGTGSGVARCDKIKYRTCTPATCFGNTAGIPIPVLNATYCSRYNLNINLIVTLYEYRHVKCRMAGSGDMEYVDHKQWWVCCCRNQNFEYATSNYCLLLATLLPVCPSNKRKTWIDLRVCKDPWTDGTFIQILRDNFFAFEPCRVRHKWRVVNCVRGLCGR